LKLLKHIQMRVDIQNKTFFKKALNKAFPELNDSDFSGISIDSRNVKPGDIFLAFKGETQTDIIISAKPKVLEHLLQ